MKPTPLAVARRRAAACLLTALALCGTAFAQAPTKGSPAHIKAAVGKVNANFMKSNASKTPDWPSYGLDYAETRHSKLNQITTANVKELGLVWSYNLESSRGVESTPLVVDGIMYVTASWSVVHAVDVRTHPDLCALMPETLSLELDWPLDESTQKDLDEKKRKPSKKARHSSSYKAKKTKSKAKPSKKKSFLKSSSARDCWVDKRSLPWCLLPDSVLHKCSQSHNRPLWVTDRLFLEFPKIKYNDHNFVTKTNTTMPKMK